MPINNEKIVPLWNQDIGNGSKTNFVYSFKIEKSTDIDVYLTPVGKQPEPATDLVSPDEYAVSGVGNESGGTVDFNTAPLNGETITILGNSDYELSTKFSAANTFFTGQNLDKALAELLFMVKQNKTYIDKLVLTYVKNILLNSPLENVIPPLTKEREIWMRLNNAITPVVLEEKPDVSTLRSELASQTQGAAGASIIGVWDAIAMAGKTLETYLTELDTRLTQVEQDVVDSKIPTGAGLYMLQHVALAGWVLADDGTIGSASSGATTRANADTEDLYTLIWSIAEKWCPIYTDAGVPDSRGASAAADFAANKRLALNKTVGRILIAAQNGASPSVAMTFTTDHPTSNTELTVDLNGGSAPTEVWKTGIAVRLTTTGALPTGLSAGTTYYITVVNNTKIKLSTTQLNCTDQVYVSVSDNGSGTHTVTTHQDLSAVRGEFGGWKDHLQQVSEIVSHDHTLQFYGGTGSTNPYPTDDYTNSSSATGKTEKEGGSTAFPIMPPFSGWNLYIKL